jgi:hypothetical protein
VKPSVLARNRRQMDASGCFPRKNMRDECVVEW